MRENIAPFNTDSKKKATENRFGDFEMIQVEAEGH